MTEHERDRYAEAGVDYGVIDPGKLLAQRTAARTAGELGLRGAREVPESRGESAYVVDLGDRYLATVTEALGTKNLVADAVRSYTNRSFYDAIAKDTAATILNDLATVGARPLCLTAYWGAGSSDWFADESRLADLVRGWGAACEEAHCAWGGGETQVLRSMIEPGVAVLGGNALGFVNPREQLLLGSRVEPGDAILVAAATGIHTNGLTLARETVGKLARGFETPLDGDSRSRSIGEALLDPTPLYGVLLEALLDAGVDVHYAVHVTGHGWRKLMRASKALSYVIERLPEVPPVLSALASAAGMSALEAYGTYNMGAGFAFYVSEASVELAQRTASRAGTPLLHAGHVEAGPKRVVLAPLGLEFAGGSLAIR
ncbi:MAG TPA: AIR synthase related protein [Polyangiaceae bacterium]